MMCKKLVRSNKLIRHRTRTQAWLSPRSSSMSKKGTFKVVSCRERYLLCASAPHPEIIWSTLSGALQYNQHNASPFELVWVFWLAHNRVRNSSNSSDMPAIVCWTGLLLCQPPKAPTIAFNASSYNLVVTKLPYHCWFVTSFYSLCTWHFRSSFFTVGGCSRLSSTHSYSANLTASLTWTAVQFPSIALQTPAQFVWPGLHNNRF